MVLGGAGGNTIQRKELKWRSGQWIIKDLLFLAIGNKITATQKKN